MQMFLNLVVVVAILAMIGRQGWFTEFQETVFGDDEHVGIVDDDRPLSG